MESYSQLKMQGAEAAIRAGILIIQKCITNCPKTQRLKTKTFIISLCIKNLSTQLAQLSPLALVLFIYWFVFFPESQSVQGLIVKDLLSSWQDLVSQERPQLARDLVDLSIEHLIICHMFHQSEQARGQGTMSSQERQC